VGILRATGNLISPPVAALFMRAFLECEQDMNGLRHCPQESRGLITGLPIDRRMR
jgi:hypothetical protein